MEQDSNEVLGHSKDQIKGSNSICYWSTYQNDDHLVGVCPSKWPCSPATRKTPPLGLLPHPPASQPMRIQPISLSTSSLWLLEQERWSKCQGGYVGLPSCKLLECCGPFFLEWAQLSALPGSTCSSCFCVRLASLPE